MKIRRILKYRIPLDPPLLQNGFEIRERRGCILISESGDPGEFAPLPGFSPSREADILRDLGIFRSCRDSGTDIPEPDLKTPEARFAAAMLNTPLNTLPEKPPVRSLFGNPDAVLAALPKLLDSISEEARLFPGKISGIKIKAGIFPETSEIALIREIIGACEARRLRGQILINPDGNKSLSPETARRYIAALGEYLGYFEDPTASLNDCLGLGVPVGFDMLWPEFFAKFRDSDIPGEIRKHRAVPVIKPALTPGFMKLGNLRPVLSSAFESPPGISWIRRLATFLDTESGTDTLKYFPPGARESETFIRDFTEELE